MVINTGVIILLPASFCATRSQTGKMLRKLKLIKRKDMFQNSTFYPKIIFTSSGFFILFFQCCNSIYNAL